MISTAVGAAFGGLQTVAGLVSGYRSGKASAEQIAQLAIRYWGCLLFELHWNLTSVREAVAHPGTENATATPTLVFPFSDSLLPELARLAPQPKAIAEAGVMCGLLKNVQTMVDVAQQAGAQHRPAGAVSVAALDLDKTWSEYARENLPRWLETLEELRAGVAAEAERLFGEKEWQGVKASILPLSITP